MLMIWAIMLMSFTVMGVVTYMQKSVEESGHAAIEFRALHYAESGLAAAMNPAMTSSISVSFSPSTTATEDPTMVQVTTDSTGTTSGDSGFKVTKTREGGRMPINYITDAMARESVYNLFIYWGLDVDAATTATDSLADWVDSDKDARPQGAEEDYYKGLGIYNLPRQQGFTSLDEMLLVRGFHEVARVKPDWREYFSLYGNGKIDLAFAPKDVIIAVTGASEPDVLRLDTARVGNDGIRGTEDDNTKLGLNGALSYLSIPPERLASVQSFLVWRDNEVFHIESVGWVGLKTVKLTVIARYATDGSLSYLARSEE